MSILLRLFRFRGLARFTGKNGGHPGSDGVKTALFYPRHRAGTAWNGLKAAFAGWM